MTTSRRVLIKCGAAAIVCVILLLGAAGLSRVFFPKNNDAEHGMIDPVANGMLGESKDSIDVLFVGDSEVYASFSPLQMWHERGFTAYDSSTDAQVVLYSDTLLKRAFTKQSPRVVVFETDSFYFNFSLGEVLFRIAADQFPVFDYHDRWKSMTPADFVETPQATWSDPNKGFEIKMGVAPVPPEDLAAYGTPSDEIEEIPSKNQFWLRMMVDFCHDHGATPVFMSAPSPFNWSMARHNGIQACADELGVTHYDLNLIQKEIGIDWRRDTSDAGDHLNYYGAEKVSRYVGELLSKTYELKDRRSDPAYATWHTSYEAYDARVRLEEAFAKWYAGLSVV